MFNLITPEEKLTSSTATWPPGPPSGNAALTSLQWNPLQSLGMLTLIPVIPSMWPLRWTTFTFVCRNRDVRTPPTLRTTGTGPKTKQTHSSNNYSQSSRHRQRHTTRNQSVQ